MKLREASSLVQKEQLKQRTFWRGHPGGNCASGDLSGGKHGEGQDLRVHSKGVMVKSTDTDGSLGWKQESQGCSLRMVSCHHKKGEKETQKQTVNFQGNSKNKGAECRSP